MKKILYLFLGVFIGGLLAYFVMKQFQHRKTGIDSHVIEYELKKLNKMIVAEQMFSDVYSYKNQFYFPGLENYFSFDKKILYLVNAKVQASYDLKELEVEMDEKNKIIYINKVPDVEIKVYPDVSIYDMDQSVFNKFDKDELNEIKDDAIKVIEKKIDEESIKKEAREQLIENLGDLYMLAKAYDWEIVDNTSYSQELELLFN